MIDDTLSFALVGGHCKYVNPFCGVFHTKRQRTKEVVMNEGPCEGCGTPEMTESGALDQGPKSKP